LVADVQLVDLLHLGSDGRLLTLQCRKELLLLPYDLVRLVKVGSQVVGRQEEVPELLPEDVFQGVSRDLVATLLADVFRDLSQGVHLSAALTEGQPGEQVNCWLGWSLAGGPTLIQDRVALCPKLLRHDGLYGAKDPLTLGLLDPVLLVSGALGVVGAASTLGRRVP
jgi:hypothetical protein